MCATSSPLPFLPAPVCFCCTLHLGDMLSLALLSQVMLLCVALVCVAGKLAQGCLLPTWCLPALQLQGATLGCISQ